MSQKSTTSLTISALSTRLCSYPFPVSIILVAWTTNNNDETQVMSANTRIHVYWECSSRDPTSMLLSPLNNHLQVLVSNTALIPEVGADVPLSLNYFVGASKNCLRWDLKITNPWRSGKWVWANFAAGAVLRYLPSCNIQSKLKLYNK